MKMQMDATLQHKKGRGGVSNLNSWVGDAEIVDALAGKLNNW
jgi:hypothetical protein